MWCSPPPVYTASRQTAEIRSQLYKTEYIQCTEIIVYMI